MAAVVTLIPRSRRMRLSHAIFERAGVHHHNELTCPPLSPRRLTFSHRWGLFLRRPSAAVSLGDPCSAIGIKKARQTSGARITNEVAGITETPAPMPYLREDRGWASVRRRNLNPARPWNVTLRPFTFLPCRAFCVAPRAPVSDKSKPSAASLAGLEALAYAVAPRQEACVSFGINADQCHQTWLTSTRWGRIRTSFRCSKLGWSCAERDDLDFDERIDLSNAQLAAAFVSSQAFANVNNAGVLLNPNVTASLAVVESLFQNTLGHHPTAATLAGFEGMTNAQAFLAFALSDTVSSVVGNEVNTYVQDYAQAEGIITTVVGAADINLFSTNIG